jgi:hypothetical protein
LRSVGADVVDAQYAARHEKATTTAQHYTHEVPDRQAALMERFDDLIQKRSG